MQRLRQLLLSLVAIGGITAGLTACDANPPVITFVNPVAGSTLSCDTTVEVDVTDADGVAKVQFAVDNDDFGWPLSPPYRITVDTVRLSDGPHQFRVQVTDNLNNVTTSSIQVNVSNPVGPAASPVPGNVILGGDSITFQSLWGHGYGVGAPSSIRDVFYFGWRASDVLPLVQKYASGCYPAQIMVVALGTNDSNNDPLWGGDGWTPADRENFQSLIEALHDDTCVVMILPGHGPMEASFAAEMDEAHADLQTLAAAYPDRVVIEDWQASVNANPSLLGRDGIHLPVPPGSQIATSESAAARHELYWRGVDTCEQRLALGA